MYKRQYLNRLVTRASGRCYTAYVRDLLLEETAARLTGSGESIRSILQDMGYSNRGYFNRIFSEKYGMLPNQYRKDNKTG